MCVGGGVWKHWKVGGKKRGRQNAWELADAGTDRRTGQMKMEQSKEEADRKEKSGCSSEDGKGRRMVEGRRKIDY